MSSFWNSNCALFCKRFPALASQYGLSAQSPEPAPENRPWVSQPAKNGELTALESGRFLHSQYNPQREAEQAIRAVHTKDTLATAFFGFGLGYAPAACARLFPHDTLVVIEPDADWFFAALTACDWSDVFKAENLILALQAGVDTVTTLIEQAGGGSFNNVAVIAQANQTAHANDYFAALAASLRRARQKASINTFTLEKFSRLWLRNSCKNLAVCAALPGVQCYHKACAALPDTEPLPALVLAAGPTLQAVLPHLAELKKRMLIIAVDTALRACLQAGVEPDFIVLVDPQYYAWRHLAGLSASTSVLITESAAYPAAFRFPCRKIILCSSLFPLGKYFEKRMGAKGELAAGGSVSTTAWDFARLCGAKRIYMAGLDLGYPNLETHIRGSTFEERLHISSERTRTAETGGAAALFGANMKHARTYDGSDILTDDRMQLFAWWFESKQQEFASSVQSYTLSSRSLAIPGLTVARAEDLLAEPERPNERAAFFAAEEAEADGGASSARSESAESAQKPGFEQVHGELTAGLQQLYQTARRGVTLCEEALDGTIRAKKGVAYFIRALQAVDSQILQSELKDIASLVFPTERQLEALYEKELFSADAATSSFQHSKIIYRELQKSIRAYLTLLA